MFTTAFAVLPSFWDNHSGDLFPLSLPFLPFPSLRLEGHPWNPARVSGGGCKLPQQGLGRMPSRNRFWCILAVKYDIWWQQFNYFPENEQWSNLVLFNFSLLHLQCCQVFETTIREIYSPSPSPSPPSAWKDTPEIQLGGLGSAVSSTSGVWGGCPSEIEFGAF